MWAGMLAVFAVALLLDARLRRDRAARRGVERRNCAERMPSTGTPPPDATAARDLTDDELVARVQAMVAIPSGVEVTAVEGAVVLFGRIPRFAFAPLLSRVARVPGVVDVEDRLTPVDDVGGNERA